MEYRIKGCIRYEFRNHRRISVDQIINAETPEKAVDLITEKLIPYDDGELYDSDPDIEVIPIEDGLEYDVEQEKRWNHQLMQGLGPHIAPMLFSDAQGLV